MPQILAWLGGLLLSIAGDFILRALFRIGVGVVTYTGFSFTLDWLKAQAVSGVMGLPPDVVGLLGVLKIGVCISIVFSAYAVRLTTQGLTSDKVKKWVTK